VKTVSINMLPQLMDGWYQNDDGDLGDHCPLIILTHNLTRLSVSGPIYHHSQCIKREHSVPNSYQLHKWRPGGGPNHNSNALNLSQ
jgi:hypothetical protein